MQMHLQVVVGGHEGKLIAVNQDKFLIGRSDECHLRPKSESISRRHCAIIRKDGRILLIDLKSRNGTIVNDKKIDPSRAKVLKNGDHIKVGKLEFIAVIEAGIANVKKPEVRDVKDAAARSVQNSGDSKYEDVDVSSWLQEPDQFERRDEPVTRQFVMDEEPSKVDINTDSTVMDAQAENDTKADIKGKNKPGKLPPMNKKPTTANSKDAATETLRKFFSGR
ncbi:MAG: FHA domain-containing protein [Planctomycetales bacterium]|nr:FHA domain-containing protein [Planctomycetales bacterium]